MIVLIEPLCLDWDHEEVNAGLLRLVDSVTNDDITYYGNDGQIKAVSEIYHSSKVFFRAITKIPNRAVADSKKAIPIYVKMLEKVILECSPHKIFICSGTIPCMIAAGIVAKMNPKVDIFMALHSIFEPKFGYSGACLNVMRKNLKNKNLKWILYSASAEKFLLHNGIKSGIFLHLPYIGVEKEKDMTQLHEKYRIAVIGACANENAVRLIEAVGRTKELTGKFEFWILSRKSNAFGGCKNVKILRSEFARNHKEELLTQVDYVLLPYGRNDYRASTSGVLMDAISNKVPCIAYDSPCVCYYQKRHHVGIQAESLSEMLEVLKGIVQGKEKENEYFINVENIEKENQKIAKKILLRV